MRIAASIAITLAALCASTDARAERGSCEVLFVRAPDDVRLVIESWLEAEPRCSGTIELRVVEMENGSLYLIAQRPDGRIHEREVPDAQSAGVLVASWVADDWTSPPPDEKPVTPPPAVAPITVDPFAAAPGITDTIAPAAPRSTGRWFSAAGMIQTEGEGGAGARFEMDLTGGRSSKWTLGVALAGVSSQMTAITTSVRLAVLETIDLRALFVAARTWRLGENWNVRWSFGLGPMYTDAEARLYDDSDPMPYSTGDGVSLAYESTLTLAREFSEHRWAITAGPAATLISQELNGNAYGVSRHKVELMFALGLRYRL
jgi:hypothetical protein